MRTAPNIDAALAACPPLLRDAWRRVLDKEELPGLELAALPTMLAQCEGAALDACGALAEEVRRRFTGAEIRLCAIINARSGRCSEDCAFCAQSSRYRTGAPVYPLLPAKTLIKAATRMRDNGVGRCGIVLSGLALSDADLDILCEVVAAIEQLGLRPDLSCGVASKEQLQRLTAAGLAGYHHNLETSASFFPSICGTHAYQDDVDAVRLAVDLGLYVCSGGIFGLGERWEDRLELALTLRSLRVQGVPLNFLVPIPGTPLENRPILSPDEARRIVALFRLVLPNAHLRLCGGRGRVFGADKRGVLTCGAGGLMVGDYLTIPGEDVRGDLDAIQELGMRVAKEKS
jgi:biotin synthase